MRKGISPLVAVIMLIAFTLIVAGILAGWATQFAQTQRRAIEYCVDAGIAVERATYNASNETLFLFVYNNGRVPLEVNILLSYTNITLHPEGIEQYPGTFNTTAGTFHSFNLQNITSDLEEVTIRSIQCPGATSFMPRRNIRGMGI